MGAMSVKDILSQNHIIGSFRNAISKGRLSHAYIFAGQKGTGRSSFAKELSKTIFCQNKQNNVDHCGKCHSCKRIANNNHPDIHWIVLGENDKFIKIESIRELQHYVKLSPIESDHKVFIIKDADRMNEEASNCLLKTLEEPTLNTNIVLISNSLMQLKETIRSRCQIIKFLPVPIKIVKEQLLNKYNTGEKEAEWASRFCGGSIGNAIELVSNKSYERNAHIIKLVSELNTDDNFTYAEEFIVSYLSECGSSEEKRRILKDLFECMLLYYRDLLIAKIRNTHVDHNEDLMLFNADREEAMQIQSNYFTKEKIMSVIDEIINSITSIDYNVNINLLIENIFTRIAILKSGK